jgi:hypothetical protein
MPDPERPERSRRIEGSRSQSNCKEFDLKILLKTLLIKTNTDT